MRRNLIRIALAAALTLTAFTAGYTLTTRVGAEFLRRDIEARLSDLLAGEVHIDAVQLILRDGLGVRGENVTVYPASGGPGLFARHASVELNEPALLLGNFELAELVVEDLQVRLTLDSQGHWSFPPLRALQLRETASDEATDAVDEPLLEPLAALESISRLLLEDLRIADRVSLHGGVVRFEDHRDGAKQDAASPPRRLLLTDATGTLERPWLSGDGSIALDATLVDSALGEMPLRLTGTAEDGSVRVQLELSELDLDVLDPDVLRLAPGTDPDGVVTGTLSFATPRPSHQTLELAFACREIGAGVALRGESVHIAPPLAEFTSRLDVDPDTVQLTHFDASGPRMGLGLEGAIERPLRASSLAHLTGELREITMEDLRPITRQLPEQDREALAVWFDRITSGRVDQIALSGSAPLARWGSLLQGELRELPRGFLLSMRASDVVVQANEEPFTDVSFEASWSQDRLEVRDAVIHWRDAQIPVLTVTLEGVSRLVQIAGEPIEVAADPIPGFSLLWETLSGKSEDDDAQGAAQRFQVHIDHVEHPILRWPIEDALVVFEPAGGGGQVDLLRAKWGGIPIAGEGLYLRESPDRLLLTIEAVEGTAKTPDAPETPDAKGAVAATPSEPPVSTGREAWGSGRIELAPTATAIAGSGAADEPLLTHLRGDFELVESELRLSDLVLTASSGAMTHAHVRIDLGDADELGIEVRARIDDGDVALIGSAAGLPAGVATGTVDVSAELQGTLRREENLLNHLSGGITFVAEDGEIRRRLPLIVAIAAATDGFNPLASRDSVQYDSMSAELRLDDGRLHADRFQLEGPVRVYAKGTVDFAHSPQPIEVVVGVFLLQRVGKVLGMIPLVNLVVPGSDKGMVGAYFRVTGPWDDPAVVMLAGKSLHEGLPSLLTKPFDILHQLLTSANLEPPNAPAAGESK